MNRIQRKFIKFGFIAICAGLVIQSFGIGTAIEYVNITYPHFPGENYQLKELFSYPSIAFKVFVSGISLICVGLGVIILGIKKQRILIKILDFSKKPFLNIKKRKAVESGIFIGMVGALLLSSSLTLLFEQRCDNVSLAHNLCGVNLLTDKIISILFLFFGAPLLLGGTLLFIVGMKKISPKA